MRVRTLQIPHTPGWKMLANGSWTGGIGVLQREEADICSVPTGTGFNQTSHEL